MPPITAFLHCSNDALRLGRTLEMLLPCSEILIVDHHSSDGTTRVARKYGARIVEVEIDRDPSHYLEQARHDWILCMKPGESITENLQASLFEFSDVPLDDVKGMVFSVLAREQDDDTHWRDSPGAETRLIPRSWGRWQGPLPAHDPSATRLAGELLRFAWP